MLDRISEPLVRALGMSALAWGLPMLLMDWAMRSEGERLAAALFPALLLTGIGLLIFSVPLIVVWRFQKSRTLQSAIVLALLVQAIAISVGLGVFWTFKDLGMDEAGFILISLMMICSVPAGWWMHRATRREMEA
jgi:hypothetical protein